MNWYLKNGCFGSAIAACLASPAIAIEDTPSAQSQASGIEEIIVTATRRETKLQRTPIAVSAVSEQNIKQMTPRNIGDLAVLVPNFSAATITGFNSASFAIRGVGQANAIIYFEPAVAVLVDDFVIPSVQTQLLDTFDISQVEVLRGPQGTLFGKNTTGGAVVVRTKAPILDEVGAEGQLMYGRYNNVVAHAAVNLPIIGDKLALRAVMGYEYSDGYYRNGACFGPVTAFAPSKFAGVQGCQTGERLGGKDVLNARVKLLWKPSDTFDALLQYEWMRDSSDPVPSVNETPVGDSSYLMGVLGVGSSSPSSKDPLKNAGASHRNDGIINMSSGQRIDVDGLYLNMSLHADFGTLVSVSGYREQRTRLPGSFVGQVPVAPDGDELSLFDLNRADDRKTYQQELRFASALDGPFNFVAGGFYQHEKINFCVDQILGFLDIASGPSPFGPWNDTPYVLCNAQKSRSTAVFAEGTLKITPDLTLTAGARYTWEKKIWRGRQQTFLPLLNGGVDPITIDDPLDANVYDYPLGVIKVTDKVKKPTWRVSLGYQFNPEIFGYATYSRGFKAGGFNDQIGTFTPFGNDLAAFAEAASPTRPETADSYEAGIKMDLLNRTIRLNLAGFWVDYSDLQRQINVPIKVNGVANQVTRFFNAASARARGVEAELTAVPTKHLTLRGVVGYLDAKYKRFETPLPAGYNLADAPLERAPKWQWTAGATWDIPLENYRLSFNGNVSHVGRNLFTQSLVSAADNTFLDAHTLLDASITVASLEDSYYFRLVGRNLTDERYRTASQAIAGLWAYSQYGAPRFFGVEVGFNFGGRRR